MSNLRDTIGAEPMRIIRCKREDMPKHVKEWAEKGFGVACYSNAGMPRGMLRVTFLPKSYFHEDEPKP